MMFSIFLSGDQTSDLRNIFTDWEGQGFASSTNFCLLRTFLKGQTPVCFNFPSLLSFQSLLSFFLRFSLSILSCQVTRFSFRSFSLFCASGSGISCEFRKVLAMRSSSSERAGRCQSALSLGLSCSAARRACRSSSWVMQLSERPMKTPLERMQASVLSRAQRQRLMRQAQSMTRLRLLPCAEKMMQHSACSSASSMNRSSFFSFFRLSSHSRCVRSLISLNFRYLMPWLSKQFGISAEQFTMYANLLIVRNSKSLVAQPVPAWSPECPGRARPLFSCTRTRSPFRYDVILTNNAKPLIQTIPPYHRSLFRASYKQPFRTIIIASNKVGSYQLQYQENWLKFLSCGMLASCGLSRISSTTEPLASEEFLSGLPPPLLRVQHLWSPLERYSALALAQTSLLLTKWSRWKARRESSLRMKVPHCAFSNSSQSLFSASMICSSKRLACSCSSDRRLWFSACRCEICPSLRRKLSSASPYAPSATPSITAVQFSTSLASSSSASSQMSSLRHSCSSPSKAELASQTCPSTSLPSPPALTLSTATIFAILDLWLRVFASFARLPALSRSMLRSLSTFGCDFFSADRCSICFPSDFFGSRLRGQRLRGPLWRERRGWESLACVFFRQVLARVQVVL